MYWIIFKRLFYKPRVQKFENGTQTSRALRRNATMTMHWSNCENEEPAGPRAVYSVLGEARERDNKLLQEEGGRDTWEFIHGHADHGLQSLKNEVCERGEGIAEPFWDQNGNDGRFSDLLWMAIRHSVAAVAIEMHFQCLKFEVDSSIVENRNTATKGTTCGINYDLQSPALLSRRMNGFRRSWKRYHYGDSTPLSFWKSTSFVASQQNAVPTGAR